MNKHLKTLIVATSIAVASTSVAFADGGDGSGGDSGNSSMSRWTGESYKAFDQARSGAATFSAGNALKGKAGKLAASCDNGMSQWCGDSFAAFRQGMVGDFYTGRDELANSSERIIDPARHVVASTLYGWQVGRAFRDDTSG